MNSATAFVLVVGISLGLAVMGLALRTLREERETAGVDRADTPAAVDEAPRETTAADEESAPSTSREDDAPEQLRLMARLLRDLDGRLVVEVDGRQYRDAGELEDTLVRTRLSAAVGDLQRLLQPAESAPAAEATMPETPPSRSQDTATADADTVPEQATPATLPQADSEVDVIKVSLAEAARMPIEKPSMNVLDQWRYLRKRETQPRVEIKTVLDEIDELLQARITDTPWAERGLRIGADVQTGEAQFYLDERVYTSVDDVPEAEAQEIIRASIAEWERQ